MLGAHLPEIAGDYARKNSGASLIGLDLTTLCYITYSYFVSDPNEYRHEFRKNFEEFLTRPIEEIREMEDTRDIKEQAVGLMDDWAAMEALLTQQQPAPPDPPD